MAMWRKIPCSLYRGGTSRAVFFLEQDVPSEPTVRDNVLLAAIGYPDPARLSGLGGLTVNTSKVILVRKSNLPGTDIDFTLGQVSLTEPVIDYTPLG